MTWFSETRGTRFELIRHFLRGMFEGDWSSSPGQWSSAAVGLFALLLPSGLLLVREGSFDPRYAGRYAALGRAAGASALHDAAILDELALITLLMCVVGLLALLEWQSMFPSRRDLLALASLPVRPGQLFTSRFASVLLFSTGMVVAVNLLPSLIAPVEFGGGWRLDSAFLHAAAVQALASGLACFFVYFAIVALQGVMLNLLPPALFARVSVYVQGLLAGIFLLFGLYSWSMKQWPLALVYWLPVFGELLPSAWFTALQQTLSNNPDRYLHAMADRAELASAIALGLAALTYLIAWRRYRRLLLELPSMVVSPGVSRWSVTRLLAGSPRREAILDFMAKTLVRSRTHRLLWMVYIGAAVAVVLNSSLIDGAFFVHATGLVKALQFLVLFWPLACSIVLLSGFRHVLSIPSELRANWIFRMVEEEGRAEWMSAVERFILAYAVAPIYLILFPVAGWILGWPLAARMAAQQIMISLIMFELLFYSWQKLPFTCSYQPGDKPLVGVVGKYLVILGVVAPIVSAMISAAAQFAFLFPIYFLNFAGIWIWARRLRREGWGESKLLYEDQPTTVADIGLKDLTYSAGLLSTENSH